jgi:deferrochelatase/peroxidase EfeB
MEACPFGAHIRRANPRTADLPVGRRLHVHAEGARVKWRRARICSPQAGFTGLIRRGRAYGNAIGRECGAHQNGSRIRTGLHFIALNANIVRQFQFVQNSWIVNSKCNAFDGEFDPFARQSTCVICGGNARINLACRRPVG